MIDWNDNAKAAVMEYAKYMEQERIANGWLNGRGDFSPKSNFKATRENLEKIAKDAQGDFEEVEQEGERWTHVTSIGKCRILVDKPDEHGYIVVEMESDGYSLIPERKLKPIKPTISKAQAWDMLVDFDESIHHFHDKYEALKEQYDII